MALPKPGKPIPEPPTTVKQGPKHGGRTQSPIQQIHFSLAHWDKSLPIPGFACMADTGQFTITGGWQKINIIDRPRQTGVTAWAGFDPITATLPIIIEHFSLPGTTNYVNSVGGGVVENAVATLMWFAGIGLPLGGEHPLKSASNTKQHQKGPAVVYVTSLDGRGKATHVIPPMFQYDHVTKRTYEWLVTALEFGESIRDTGGNLQRQKVTVTLTQNQTAAGTGTSVGRWKATKGSDGWHKVTIKNTSMDTPKKLAEQLNISGPDMVSTAKAIQKNSHNAHLHLRSIESKIKLHTKVWIPKRAIK